MLLMKRMNEDQVIKAADTVAGGAAVAAGISWAAAANMVAVVAGIFAIFAACASAWFHVERALALRDARLKRELEKLAEEARTLVHDLPHDDK